MARIINHDCQQEQRLILSYPFILCTTTFNRKQPTLSYLILTLSALRLARIKAVPDSNAIGQLDICGRSHRYVVDKATNKFGL